MAKAHLSIEALVSFGQGVSDAASEIADQAVSQPLPLTLFMNIP